MSTPAAPPTFHVWYISQENTPFLCVYCQEGDDQPARCALLQEHTQAKLITYETGTGYMLPNVSHISHDTRHPVFEVVLSYDYKQGIQVTTVELTADSPALGGSSMIACFQSPPPPLDPSPPVVSSPTIELFLVPALTNLAGNEVHDVLFISRKLV